MSELPSISIVTVLHDLPQFHVLLEHNWNTLDYPKDKLEWIIVDDSKEDNSDKIPINDNILYIKVSSEEYLKQIEFKKDDEKTTWNYHNKMGILPSGFMRDYAVGLTSNDYIIHFDIDTIYNPNTIKRKLRFLKDNKLECVYCKSMLSYDIYNNVIYKVENNFGYESTLFHTKDFWGKGGFKWEDTHSEAVAFYYGKGLDRKMDNYYDTIKLLSVHNIHKYKPIKIELENIKIDIPDIVSKIESLHHPLNDVLNDLFYKKNIDVLSIDSFILDKIKNEGWNTYSIQSNKRKEKKIISEIEIISKKFDLCFINISYPIWNIFDKIKFDCIILETDKNVSQMEHILKGKDYINFGQLFFRKDFLNN